MTGLRALLSPIVITELGVVAFKPGSQLMPYFRRGRILLESEPERLADLPSGEIPAAEQPLAEDPALRSVFTSEAVLRRAGGLSGLEDWLLRDNSCQWPHESWHMESITTMRHVPGAIRLCWHCDNLLRDQATQALEAIALANCAAYILSTVRRELGFDDTHALTLPELCWWLAHNGLIEAIPETAARQVLRLPKPVIHSVTREADLVPTRGPSEIVQETAARVLV